MTDEFPEDDPHRTALHEGGHTSFAWSVNPDSVKVVAIGHRQGDTVIWTDGFTDDHRAALAIAGTFAEARGVAGVAIGGDFSTTIRHIVNHMSLRELPYGGQWLPVPLAGGGSQAAVFSDHDYVELSRFCNTEACLANLLPGIADFVNENIGRIQELANKLHTSGKLTAEEVGEILG